MVHNNPLFTKESLKAAASYIGNASFTLIYDGNDTHEQKKAGKELWQAEWIIATIMDHVFDYYPSSYFMNDDSRKEYPDYLEWFLDHPEVGVRNAIKYVENNFCILDTVTRDDLNQHRIPQRNLTEEKHVKSVFTEIQNNLSDIVHFLNGPKKILDPSKPTADQISMLIKTIKQIQIGYSKMADDRQDTDLSIQVFRTNKIFEMFKLPLLKAWEVYHYGSHSDFWEEGDSMFDYMMFEMKAKEMIGDLIKVLSQESPFASFEHKSAITNGLLNIYRHLINQKLD